MRISREEERIWKIFCINLSKFREQKKKAARMNHAFDDD